MGWVYLCHQHLQIFSLSYNEKNYIIHIYISGADFIEEYVSQIFSMYQLRNINIKPTRRD